MDLEKVMQLIKEKQGFSFFADGREPIDGYMVSIPNVKKGFYHSKSDFQLIETLETMSKLACNIGCTIGGWYDKQTGRYYLDLSFNVSCKETAISMGCFFDQVSIWDVANAVEIYLKQTA